MQLRTILPCLALSFKSRLFSLIFLFAILTFILTFFGHHHVVRSAVDLVRAGYGRVTLTKRQQKEHVCGGPPYPLCIPEPASRSWRRRCRRGRGTDTPSRRAPPARCWGTASTGTGQTCPRVPAGPSSGGGAWWQRTARSSPAPRWATPGRERHQSAGAPTLQGPHCRG